MEGKALLWTAVPRNLRPPRLLWSAGTASDVGEWRKRNPWADATELVLFQAEHEDDVASIGTPFQKEDPAVPWRVLNGPTGLSRRLLESWYRQLGIAETQEADDAGVPPFVRSMSRYGVAARMILATKKEVKPQWTICANADGGALAVWAATVHGRHVALDAGPPSPIAVQEAVKHGVSILVAQESDAHRINVWRDAEREKP